MEKRPKARRLAIANLRVLALRFVESWRAASQSASRHLVHLSTQSSEQDNGFDNPNPSIELPVSS